MSMGLVHSLITVVLTESIYNTSIWLGLKKCLNLVQPNTLNTSTFDIDISNTVSYDRV